MSTTDVRADGSSDEKQATSGDTEGGDGSLGETGEAKEASASGGDLSRETGAAGEPGDGADVAAGADGDEEAGAWDDGLIARRARGASVPGERQAGSRAAALWGVEPGPASSDAGTADESGWEFAGGAGRSERQRASDSHRTSQGSLGTGKAAGRPLTDWPVSDASSAQAYENEAQGEAGSLGRRVAALHRLLDLSRSRIPGSVLVEAQRVLDAAGARKQLPRAYTTVAIAGATGSGKSSLFNALAGTRLSQAGMRRPTTATPVACSWEVPGAGPADGLLDRLAIPASTRRLMRPESDWRGRIDDAARNELEGLVLIDLPDHDSAAEGHREQVDRLLRLVDAVVWVVDPEKYADAVLHERYLRPLAGYAEVTFIVLNQTDRLPGEAKDAVLNDLRRLLDEDGMALGEHGEPGARVLATSALVGEGIDELRTEMGAFVAERRAAGLRLNADLDGIVERLRPVYSTPGQAVAANALPGLTEEVRDDFADQLARAAGAVTAGQASERTWLRLAERACGTPWAQLQHWYDERRSTNSQTEVPELADAAADTDHEAGAHAMSGTDIAHGVADVGSDVPAAAYAPAASGTSGAVGASGPAGAAGASRGSGDALPRVSRPAVAHAVRTVVEQAAAGLPEAWHRSVRDAAWRGASGLPEALDEALREEGGPEGECEASERTAGNVAKAGRARAAEPAPVPRRPVWWTLALVGQLMLLALQVLGAVWVLGTALGAGVGEEWMGVALLIGGVLGASLLAWGCRFAARGPAAVYGQREEWRLRRLVAACGQVRVLEPVAAELLRYREVREQYVIVAGDAPRL